MLTFLFQDKERETAAQENIAHVDKRRLKQMPNESQASNFTTSSGAFYSGVKVLSTLPTATVQTVHVDKKKASSKDSPEMHHREFHVGHEEEPNPTWMKFPWTKEVMFFICHCVNPNGNSNLTSYFS